MAPPQLDDSGSEVKRSLLLFVLRPDPVRLVKAGQSSFRPGPVVHALAGTLSGYAATYSRLERDLKGDAQRHAAMSLVALNRLAVVQQSGSDHEAEISLTSTDDEPLGVARAVTRIGGLVLSDRKLEPTDEMKKLYFQAKSARFALRFDPVWNRFLADVEIGEDNTRQVFIEAGRPSRHNQPSVQFSTNCELAGGRSAKALGKSELLSLLERNADLDMQCRFGISRTDGRLQLVAHQLIETLDIQELRAHLDSVARTAHEVTVSIAGTAKGAAAVESD